MRFLSQIKVWRRSSVGYAGPSGGDFPLITKEGHNVLDLIFTSPIQNLGTFFILVSTFISCLINSLIYFIFCLYAAEVADSLSQVVGVVEHGVISRIPSVPTTSLFLFHDEALIYDIYFSSILLHSCLCHIHFFNKIAGPDNYQLTKAY